MGGNGERKAVRIRLHRLARPGLNRNKQTKASTTTADKQQPQQRLTQTQPITAKTETAGQPQPKKQCNCSGHLIEADIEDHTRAHLVYKVKLSKLSESVLRASNWLNRFKVADDFRINLRWTNNIGPQKAYDERLAEQNRAKKK
jgi:hypothetical protein